MLAGAPAECAAELIETAGLARLAGLSVRGLAAGGMSAAERLNNPHTIVLLNTADRPKRAVSSFNARLRTLFAPAGRAELVEPSLDP